MSFVIAAPEALVAVASDLAGIGSALAEANAAALAPTTALLAAGADEVSAAIAALFGAHGQAYQTVSAQASAFHAQFVQALTGGGGAYAAAEAANVSAAQSTDQRLLDLINGPTQALLGRPLIGDGANGGPGQDGGPGGLLYGNGGNGGTSTTAGVAGGNGGAAGLIGQRRGRGRRRGRRRPAAMAVRAGGCMATAAPAPPAWPGAPGAPLPPLPNSSPPSPPAPPGVVALAPSPISGRPSSVWVGALMRFSRFCSTLVASANMYEAAPVRNVCTNCW